MGGSGSVATSAGGGSSVSSSSGGSSLGRPAGAAFRLHLSMLGSRSLALGDACRLVEAAQQFPLRIRVAGMDGVGMGQWSCYAVQLVEMPAVEVGGPPRIMLLQIGMLDILQAYTCGKASERGAKTALRAVRTGGCDGWRRVSSVDPDTYRARFCAMLPRVFIDTSATPGTLVLQPPAWGPTRGLSDAGPRYAVFTVP